MKILILMATMLAVLQLSDPAAAHWGKSRKGCDTKMLAGKWIFATEVGQIANPETGEPIGDITALGTMNITRKGAVEGVFDATVGLVTFMPGATYSGSAMLKPDCTGTLSFVTDAGSTRTDTIALVEHDEIWAMSQDPLNLWTYRVRKISGGSKRHGK